MEQELVRQLEDLDDLLAKKKEIESGKLKKLQIELDGLMKDLSALDRQNHEQLAAFPLTGSGVSNWLRFSSDKRAILTDAVWQAKGSLETQRQVLRRVVAQNQAVHDAWIAALRELRATRARRVGYAS